jgi:hypothetical protein
MTLLSVNAVRHRPTYLWLPMVGIDPRPGCRRLATEGSPKPQTHEF